MGSTPNDFSIIILPFHGGINFRPLLPDKDKEFEDADNWHDCSQNLSSDEYFSDLDVFVFVRLEGSDKTGNRVVGKYFPAVGVSREQRDISSINSRTNCLRVRFALCALILLPRRMILVQALPS